MSLSSIMNDCKVQRVANSAVAGTTEIDSDVLDMEGYAGVIFVALLGDVTVNSVLTLTVKENSASSTSSPTPTAVSGAATAAYTASATDSDNKALVVDLDAHFLTKRYVYAALTRTAANAVVDGMVAIRYKAGKKPSTADASILASAVLP